MASDLPQSEDLYFESLAALASYEAPVPGVEADERAIGSLGREEIDEETNRKLAARLAWSRSGLKLVGAASNPERGYWTITDAGRSYLAEGPRDGRVRLRADIDHAYRTRGASPEFLERARGAAESGSPLQMTVRELLENWRYGRRGLWVNQQISDDLGSLGLTTEPDFATGWIDGEVQIVLAEMIDTTTRVVGSDDDDVEREQPVLRPLFEDTISLSVSSLESANTGVMAVAMDDTLQKALSVMRLHDFSQLAVVSGRQSLRGAVTWESLAKARSAGAASQTARDCMVPPTVVRPDRHLIEVVPEIVRHGFVFVQGIDNRLVGIVTTADLSEQFVALANPFVLLGEIEQWFRRGLDVEFTSDELAAAVDPNDSERDVGSAANLTIGELKRIVESQAYWERLGWVEDRGTFVEALERVRKIRNSLMHFGPDPLSDADADHLRRFRDWLRDIVRTPARRDASVLSDNPVSG